MNPLVYAKVGSWCVRKNVLVIKKQNVNKKLSFENHSEKFDPLEVVHFRGLEYRTTTLRCPLKKNSVVTVVTSYKRGLVRRFATGRGARQHPSPNATPEPNNLTLFRGLVQSLWLEINLVPGVQHVIGSRNPGPEWVHEAECYFVYTGQLDLAEIY